MNVFDAMGKCSNIVARGLQSSTAIALNRYVGTTSKSSEKLLSFDGSIGLSKYNIENKPPALTANSIANMGKYQTAKMKPIRRIQQQLTSQKLKSNEALTFIDKHIGSLEMVFLGTASCIPSVSRGVSSLAMRYGGDVWLFDCGESTQLQIQKSCFSAARITKIFLTHTHGDHCFGLPGILCLSCAGKREEDGGIDHSDANSNVIDIYGPEGIRDYVRASLQLTYSRSVAYRIHELKNVPSYRRNAIPVIRTRFSAEYGEREGSSDIYPDKEGRYHLFTDTDFTVMAGPMKHSVPCVGYVVTEKDKPGTVMLDKIQHLVEANREALSELYPDDNPEVRKKNGSNSYMKVYRDLKALRPGESFTFPDGTKLASEDAVAAPVKGRKIVVMGDTCSGDKIEELAQNADILVHEATNAYFEELDVFKYKSPQLENHEKETISHFHSTPQMAGRFASKINAKKLFLTHFSSRYVGDDQPSSLLVMRRIEEMAITAATAAKSYANESSSSTSSYNKDNVIAAWDLMQVVIPPLNSKNGDNI